MLFSEVSVSPQQGRKLRRFTAELRPRELENSEKYWRPLWNALQAGVL
jgi:hypothetical protein